MKKSVKRKTKKELPVGAIRVLSKNLTPVVKTKASWKKTKDFDNTNVKKVVEQFLEHSNFDVLTDSKNKKFLKGYLTPEKRVAGERVAILPSGEKLDKAYSLFSPHLTIHDEKNNHHWDVIFQNPNGKFSYLYTLDKKKESQQKKYKKVENFKKRLPTLKKNLEKGIKNGELMALAIYTLLKTHFRVGSETYYKTNGHKGLTTLTKKDIKIDKEKVKFDFIGKDGVPQKTEETFPKVYVVELSNKVKPLKNDNFVFAHESGHPLKDMEFEEGFLKYCGQRFYPHIVRSYYATTTVEDFLKRNNNPSRKEVVELYNQIAERLGHKKFNKQKQEWTPSHTVTVAHYISPELVEKINGIILRK